MAADDTPGEDGCSKLGTPEPADGQQAPEPGVGCPTPELGGDERLIVELAAGKSVRDAAAASGVSERTAYRRLAGPAFRGRLGAIRREVTGRAVRLLSRAAVDAAEVLHLLATGSEDEGVRLKAAASLLDYHLKYEGHFDMDERLRRLESLSPAAPDPPTPGR